MLTLHLNIKPETEMRLKKILEYTRDEEAFVRKIIAAQIAELKNGIFQIQVQLRQFEERYSMTSNEFFRQYKRCVFADKEDFRRWAQTYEMLLENEKRLQSLK
ncbi:MAG: hypothetical protein AB7S75_20065 [Desulfococcaceae bacterium]